VHHTPPRGPLLRVGFRRKIGVPLKIRYRCLSTMFTGIVEHLGTIDALRLNADGGKLVVQAPSLSGKLQVSASIAVNGCCLTVVSVDADRFAADLTRETLDKTSFRALKPGARVNLEQPLTAGKEFGGHFVLGHVDGVGRVMHITVDGEGWRYGVEVPDEVARYIAPKGSITIDGISLTVADWRNRIVEIAVIPFTYEHTNIRDRKPGDAVNLEGDVLGKYVERHLESRAKRTSGQPLTIAQLVSEGF
jgi:riboflavin synthase